MKRVLIIGLILIGAAVLMLSYRSKDTGPWAEIRLVSVQAHSNGLVTIALERKYPNGFGIEREDYVDGRGTGYGRSVSWGLSFFSKRGTETMTFHINPGQVPISGDVTNSPQLAGLLANVGKTWRIQAGETFSLYDFTAANNQRYQCVYRVITNGVRGSSFWPNRNR